MITAPTPSGMYVPILIVGCAYVVDGSFDFVPQGLGVEAAGQDPGRPV